MQVSQKGIDLIKKFEGCKLFAYRDSVGVPTIGYGHTKNVKMGMAITLQQAEVFLKEDLKPIEVALNNMHINFTQNQFDALCSWIFNLGLGNFDSSTMKKRIVSRETDTKITDEMVKWFYANKKPLLGLKRRRVAEANMFLNRVLYYVDTQGSIIKAS